MAYHCYLVATGRHVGGWDKAGYGCFYGDKHLQNYSNCVPESETQTNNRGEIRAVLCALEHKAESEQFAVVVDSEYVFDALTENLLRWEEVLGEGHQGLSRTVTFGPTF